MQIPALTIIKHPQSELLEGSFSTLSIDDDPNSNGRDENRST